MNAQLKEIINYLPPKISDAFLKLPDNETNSITEIRIRADKPIAITKSESRVFLGDGYISYLSDRNLPRVSKDELFDIYFAFSDNSVYAHENEVKNGYLSLPYGCRAGIAGDWNIKGDGSFWLREIYSVNIRISHEVIGAASGIICNSGNILICGAPHSGKTTVLRDYVRTVSGRGTVVSLIDCRGEVSGGGRLDVGINTDVYTGGNKHKLIEYALRTMSPDLIAFDEIGTREELDAIKDCFNSGVGLAATFHARDEKDLLKRNTFVPILDCGVFDTIVFLDSKHREKIVKREEIYDENFIGTADRFGVCDSGIYEIGKVKSKSFGA